MRLISNAFASGDKIPPRYSCDGDDVSPPFNWSEPPSHRRSFALFCDDPDAPGGVFHHWALYDIPPDRTELPEGADKEADGGAFKHGINDFNRRGYSGPCPPHRHGPHRYQFRLLALSIDHLPLRREPFCRDVEREARKYALTEALLVGLYER
jgi:Raf kinase inhibitor-like YbhB/YbcL family protein